MRRRSAESGGCGKSGKKCVTVRVTQSASLHHANLFGAFRRFSSSPSSFSRNLASSPPPPLIPSSFPLLMVIHWSSSPSLARQLASDRPANSDAIPRASPKRARESIGAIWMRRTKEKQEAVFRAFHEVSPSPPRGLRARVPDVVGICGRHFIGLFGQFCHADEYVTYFCSILW